MKQTFALKHYYAALKLFFSKCFFFLIVLPNPLIHSQNIKKNVFVDHKRRISALETYSPPYYLYLKSI